MFLLFLKCTKHIMNSVEHLHSNMFLLFRKSDTDCTHCPGQFTFQYVSIISGTTRTTGKRTTKFTFQYVSIISARLTIFCLSKMYLHSNMFLLFQQIITIICTTIMIYIPICFYYFLKWH